MAVMAVIIDWMQSLPAVGGNGVGFTSKLIPTVHGECSPDYTLWWNQICVGVVEIKCRTSEYDAWLISRKKLTMLYSQYQKRGIPAMLAFGVKSDLDLEQVYFADLRDLIDNKDRWEDGEDHHPCVSSTTNHGDGKRKTQDKAHLIPKDLFWRLL
jgi:hypothetical protein